MKSFDELKDRIFSMSEDIFGNNKEPYDNKAWLRHPLFEKFLDLCLICTEIEEVLIVCPTRFTTGTNLKACFYIDGSFYPVVQGEAVDRIKIHTHSFWTKEDYALIKEWELNFIKDEDVNYFFNLLFMRAQLIILRMKEFNPDRKIVQACGPISTGSGTVEDKLIRFNKHIYELERHGDYVFDQMPFESAFGLYHRWVSENTGKHSNEGILNNFYDKIIASGFIDQGAFSNDYVISQGANWEFEKFNALGIDTKVLKKDFIANFWAERIPGLRKQ
jgi:hypothetical protein